MFHFRTSLPHYSATITNIFKMSISYINKHWRIVYEPKKEGLFQKRIRFLVGAGRLAFYIGESNANKCFKTALNSNTDKVSLKFRKCGKIDFYAK